MKVCFEDIGHMSATFAVESGEGGEPVRICGNGTVKACGDGEVFCGIIPPLKVSTKFHRLPFSINSPSLASPASRKA